MNEALCILGTAVLDRAALLQWLSVEGRWLFLVDDQSTLASFEHPRMRYFFVETPLQQTLFAKTIAWHAVLLALEVRAQSGWKTMKRQVEECHQAAHLLLSEVADFGIEAFHNARRNWQSHGPFFNWTALKSCCAGVPAIVCGAGPSLAEIVPALAALESRAVLLAAGTALPLLASWGIEPHLACALDKLAPLKQPFAALPCCLQSRLRPESAALLHGEKILAPESGPLPWESWWLENKNEQASFGWTVGNFATQIAVWMGCNPIIWVGLDGCYREGKKYAREGFGEQQVPLIKAANRAGETIWTQRDWFMAAHFHQQLAQEHPETRFIQTALHGLPFEEPIETVPFSSLAFDQQIDVRGQLHAALQQAEKIALQPDKESVWQASIERCLQGNFEQEPVYEYYLAPLWQIYQPLFAREMQGQDLALHRLLFFQQVLHDLTV